MPRTPPPAGHVYLNGAMEHLNRRGIHVSTGMVYKWEDAGRLKRHGPEERKHKWYSIAELDELADEELGIKPQKHARVRFDRATLDDMDSITAISAQLFPIPISAEKRRSWLLTEPRGHYVVRTIQNDVLVYMHLLALSPEQITQYMQGNLYGRDLWGSDILALQPGVPQPMIVAAIGSDTHIDLSLKRRCVSILLHGVARDLAQWGLQGIIVDRLYAWTETKEGILLSARLGMQQYAQPQEYMQGDQHKALRYTFSLDVLKSTNKLFQPYQHALAEWRSAHTQTTLPVAPLYQFKTDRESAQAETPQIDVKAPERAKKTPAQKSLESATSPPEQQAEGQREVLPEGWITPGMFAKQHNIKRDASINEAIREGRLKAHDGRWKQVRATALYALDREQQRQASRLFVSAPNFQQCNDPNCPCHDKP